MKNLAKKMVEVMKECGHVAKNGTNDFHQYKYDKAADVLEMVNESLTKHGIFTTVETNLLDMREVKTAKIKGEGSGQDAGDKSVAKAQTQAIKYTYRNSLAIATDDDPEADTHTDEVMSANKNSAVAKNSSPKSTYQKTTSNVCADCGAFVSKKVADYSKAKFGKYLCYDCQHSQEKVA